MLTNDHIYNGYYNIQQTKMKPRNSSHPKLNTLSPLFSQILSRNNFLDNNFKLYYNYDLL